MSQYAEDCNFLRLKILKSEVINYITFIGKSIQKNENEIKIKSTLVVEVTKPQQQQQQQSQHQQQQLQITQKCQIQDQTHQIPGRKTLEMHFTNEERNYSIHISNLFMDTINQSFYSVFSEHPGNV